MRRSIRAAESTSRKLFAWHWVRPPPPIDPAQVRLFRRTCAFAQLVPAAIRVFPPPSPPSFAPPKPVITGECVRTRANRWQHKLVLVIVGCCAVIAASLSRCVNQWIFIYFSYAYNFPFVTAQLSVADGFVSAFLMT